MYFILDIYVYFKLILFWLGMIIDLLYKTLFWPPQTPKSNKKGKEELKKGKRKQRGVLFVT